jgi:hypothetical protein
MIKLVQEKKLGSKKCLVIVGECEAFDLGRQPLVVVVLRHFLRNKKL